MQKLDGMNYAPEASGKNLVVVKPDEFTFSVIGLDHGHIYAMANGLIEAGAGIGYVFDEDTIKVMDFCKRFPQTRIASSREQILESTCNLVLSAIRPDKRFELGVQVLQSGKDYFVDKPGFLKLDDLEIINRTIEETHKKYMVYFGERIHVEGAVMAQEIIDRGLLGNIISIQILAPHRLNANSRPSWFWQPAQNGGIIADIGCHQLEQFLSFSHAESAKIIDSAVGNVSNPEHPDFQDYGQVCLITENGVMGYCRLDWFTPDGLGAWGDGRVFIVGTKATIEIRKYLNVATERKGDHIFFVDDRGEHYLNAYGKTGFPFFGDFILDCMNRTEKSMTQEHVLESMRLALLAQQMANCISR